MEHFSMSSSSVCKNGVSSNITNSSSSSLVLDSQRGELVEANVSLGKKVVSGERNTAALKNHCEAERKRRARINSHLDALRNLVPGANKMDKASLLGEVITHMKELKRTAAKASEGLLVPTDDDEVTIEEHNKESNGSPYSIRVSLCCDYKPGLLCDLRQALDSLQVMLTSAQIATLGGRMKNIFVMTSCKESTTDSVHHVIRSILDKFSASYEFLSTSALSHKRRRVSLFDPSVSSSSGDVW
ncbi:transcription factor bHLH30-like [Mercurialis annua]|uniref:transcription factor bHLH30-like n=1 Tax=Mercurialis annua TaxID=3986 RepID=UPI00215F9A55|nr:transcription factor bHLH30-like [Mercurialis annua]